MSLPPTFVKGFHYEDDVKKMEYSRMGNTHMIVSKMAIGGGTLCSQHYGDLDFEEAKATVIEAFKRGINYIDTAPFYGEGDSEVNIGKILKDIPRKAYYIATKTCRYKFKGPEQFDFSYERTMKSIDESLQRLGVDYIDLYQLHDVEFADNIDEVINGALKACIELKSIGKIKAIGINGYPLNVLKEGLEKSNGKIDTLLTYGRYTLFDDSLLDYLPWFNEINVGVIAASAHGCGMLINRGPPVWHKAKEELKKIAAEAAEICRKENVELGKLATFHLLKIPGNVATFLIGMEKREYLETNMRAYHFGLTNSENEIYEFLMKK
jgi:L-galactose dehydrogenase